MRKRESKKKNTEIVMKLRKMRKSGECGLDLQPVSHDTALNRARSPTQEQLARASGSVQYMRASEMKRASTISFMRDPLKFHSTIGTGLLDVHIVYWSAFLSIAVPYSLLKPASRSLHAIYRSQMPPKKLSNCMESQFCQFSKRYLQLQHAAS